MLERRTGLEVVLWDERLTTVAADRYMSEYFPEWYERYDVPVCSPDVYFSFEGENAGRFTWDVSGANGGLTDPEGMQRMTPEEVLETLFS